MGTYLNPGSRLFEYALNSEIYVDKTGLIRVLNRLMYTEQRYVCISRPRRFGKSMTANMVAAYYDRTVDSSLFEAYEISDNDGIKMQGTADVIRINMQDFLSGANSAGEMLSRLNLRVGRELRRAFPEVDFYDGEDLTNSMEDIFSETGRTFVVIIDEWDCLFRENKTDERGQEKYLDFLRSWLKDKAYIGLAYMTGILPIKKYGTHSALNMFDEYSMENPGPFAEYVGFTECEVRGLCRKYDMDFDDCNYWYNGYRFPDCGHIYNPRSIVRAMLSRTYDDYWNETETFEALRVYIDMNMAGLKDKITALLAGDTPTIDTRHFQNDMSTFENADDVLTLLIHLGYLGYDKGNCSVFIPNHEIQLEFKNAINEERWSGVYSALNDSCKLLQATWNGLTDEVSAGIEKAHLETSHLQYNDENALSYTVSLAYYAARQYYTLVRELPSGKGFADMAFIPRHKYVNEIPAMLIELKWNKSADSAINQIHEKKYSGALSEFKGNILLAGINYDKKSRRHQCVIERIQKKPGGIIPSS